MSTDTRRAETAGAPPKGANHANQAIPVNIAEFRNVAAGGDARVYLDSRTDELTVRRQTFLNRAVDWVRARVSRNPLEATERDAAHNRFLRAIADYSGYDGGDISRAEALLSTDVIARKPLSARRIREVLDDLDSRSTEATRDNRTKAAWMSRWRVAEQLREHGAEADEGERELIGDRIRQAVQAAGGEGQRSSAFPEAAAVADRVVADFVAQRTARSEAQSQAGASVRQDTGPPALATSAAVPDTASAPAAAPDTGSVPTAQTTARGATSGVAAPTASPPAAAPRPTSSKDLLRLLGAAKLPGNVKAQVRKLVKSGTVADRSSLAAHANRRTAEWVRENRIGRWYAQAQKHRGVGDRVRDGQMLMAPKSMLDAVAQSITGSEDIVAYPEVKDRARALIAQYVSNEIGHQQP